LFSRADALPPLRAVAAERSAPSARQMCFPDEPLEQTDPEARAEPRSSNAQNRFCRSP
jgi:hypothetical protein